MSWTQTGRVGVAVGSLGLVACAHTPAASSDVRANRSMTAQVPRPVPRSRLVQRQSSSPRERADANPVKTNALAPPTPAPTFDRFVRGTDARRCPREMALVGRVCVDKYESTVVQVLPRGKVRPWSPHLPPDTSKLPLRAVAKPGVKPQAFINGVVAQRACFAAGKRLCEPAEWRQACRGPRGFTYPYGDARRGGVCNDSGRKTHPVAAIVSRYGIPKDRMWSDGMQHPKLNQLPNTVKKTAERRHCSNDYGVYDMVGNLHEWVDDPAGTFQGGYYMDTKINGEGCNYRTTAHGFSYRDYSTGFRCCVDADDVE